MAIIIGNGSVCINSGSCNVTIIGENGRVQKLTTEDMREINIRKNINATDIGNLTINSDQVNVVVDISNTEEIEATLTGKAVFKKEPDLQVDSNGNDINITLKAEVRLSSNLLLTVKIPHRLLKKLKIKGYNSSISVKTGINAEEITLNTYNGNINNNASFKKANIDSYNGNIEVDVNANCKVEINAQSYNGNLRITLNNVRKATIRISSYNGRESNKFCEGTGKFEADINAKSHNGNVYIN